MTRTEHNDAYARHVREVQTALWWRTWGPVVRVVLWGAALAVASWLWVALAGNGCGDLAHADEGGDGAASSDGPALHVSIAVPAPVDAEVP